jgi:hypothetical protein
MATATLPEKPLLHVQQHAFGAGFLSYLVPGLGQIAQGRVGKGLLFLVCIYTLFFYGVYLGTGSITLDDKTYRVSGNVYLPDAAEDQPGAPRQLPPLLQNLYARPQFAGQFWVGVAAWPAIVQYVSREDPRPRRFDEDAPADQGKRGHKFLGDFMSEPDPVAVNAVTNAGDKRMELAWVYTVIAGVLNILVIYDAVAGPAFGLAAAGTDKKD